MANWFANQKAKRLLGDMPLTEDMTGSGGSHMTSKGPKKYDEVVLGGNKGDKSKTKPGEKDFE